MRVMVHSRTLGNLNNYDIIIVRKKSHLFNNNNNYYYYYYSGLWYVLRQ